MFEPARTLVFPNPPHTLQPSHPPEHSDRIHTPNAMAWKLEPSDMTVVMQILGLLILIPLNRVSHQPRQDACENTLSFAWMLAKKQTRKQI